MLRAAIRWAGGLFVFGAASFALYAYYMKPDAAPEPVLTGTLERGIIESGGLERSYLYYVPEKLADGPSLVLAFHGARGSGERIRAFTGYALDMLADRHGFVVVYPDGFANHWNDCRIASSHEARRRSVDDVAFTRSLIAGFRSRFGIDAARVFALGFSNGGQMVYRLALESPEEFGAVAAIGANLPRPENSDCEPSGRPLAVAVVNGTADRVNPYEGGEVATLWTGNLGRVESTVETIAYFRRLAGLRGTAEVYRYPEQDGNPATRVERMTWSNPASPAVALFSVHGGGHTIPQPVTRLPRILGVTAGDINAIEEIWKFFERQGERSPALSPSD